MYVRVHVRVRVWVCVSACVGVCMWADLGLARLLYVYCMCVCVFVCVCMGVHVRLFVRGKTTVGGSCVGACARTFANAIVRWYVCTYARTALL